jgi:flagellar biogenesis protein FliO
VSHGPVDSWKFLAGFAGLAAALWYWKRRAPSASASPATELQVVRRAALGNRGEVVVIDVAGQRMLLGVTPTSVQMLTMLDEPTAPRATETVADDAGMSFEARLTAAHALASARDDARRSRHTMPGVAPDRDYDREPPRDYDREPPRRATSRFDTHARKGAIEEQARGLLALGAQR